MMIHKDKTLVVGDVHVSVGQNLRRADWLGWAIGTLRPNRVVFIGDFMTFDVFSAWDAKKSLLMEGRRYAKEIAAGKQFIQRMYDGIDEAKRESMEPFIEPDFIITEGNHEDRLHRYLASHPEMEGNLDYMEDLDISDWEHHPYRTYYRHAGIDFTHVPLGANGKPITGKYVCQRAVDISNNGVVFGHTHKLGTAAAHRHGAKHLTQALNVGCWFEHIDDYAKGSVTEYWRGLVLLDHYSPGRFAYEAIPMTKIQKAYNMRDTYGDD